jgi:hypothetical protein
VRGYGCENRDDGRDDGLRDSVAKMVLDRIDIRAYQIGLLGGVVHRRILMGSCITTR